MKEFLNIVKGNKVVGISLLALPVLQIISYIVN